MGEKPCQRSTTYIFRKCSISIIPCLSIYRLTEKKKNLAEVLRELLHTFPNLAMTTDLSNLTALHTVATQGHIDVVNLLLESDSNLAKIARNNGKIVLHFATRMGHLEVVKALLKKDPSTGFRTDKKGQTALHMVVKGQNEEILLELVKPDPSVLILEDNKGNTCCCKEGSYSGASLFFYYSFFIKFISLDKLII